MKMHKSFIFRYVDRDILESDHRKAFLFDTLYAWMHYIEGIPTLILNFIVFVSIIIIIKQPNGTSISPSSKSKRATSKNNAHN